MTAVASQHVSPGRVTPPRRRDRLVAWLILLGCLVVAAAAMLNNLSRPLVTSETEADAVAMAVQTWRRQLQFEGESWSYERLAAYHEGLARLGEPPARTWLHLVSLMPISYDSSLDEVVYRARMVSMVFVLLTIGAAFWAGMSIGGVVTASLAGLVCLSQPVVLFSGRLATSDAIELGLSMLAIASALWAIRPLRPTAALLRQGLGWGMCGLALGAATLTGGPEALVTVLVPMAVMLLLVPHRIGHVLGLVAALLITALLVTPWAGYAHLQQPDAWRSWIAALLPQPTEGWVGATEIAGLRLGWIFLGVAPWTLWLIAALIQPFSTSSEGSRNRLFIGWAWFVTIAIMLALEPGNLTMGRLLAALTAASVLIGQLFRHGADLSDEGRHARFWRWLRWPQWSVMLAISLILPAMGLCQGMLVESQWLSSPRVAEMHALFWIGLAIILVGIVMVSLRFVINHFPARALVCWAMWSVVLFALMMFPLSHGMSSSAIRTEAHQLAAIIGDKPIAYLTDSPRPDAVLMFYTDRVFAPINMRQLHQLVQEEIEMYLLAPQQVRPGSTWVRRHILDQQNLVLWHHPPPQPTEESAS